MSEDTTREVNRIGVTSRDFNEVAKGLRLTEEGFRNGEVVVSLGEGASGFARILAENNPQIKVLAIDPVYKMVADEAQGVSPEDSEAELRSWLKVGSFMYQGEDDLPKKLRSLTKGRPANLRYVAGLGGKLPFPDNSVNRVYSHRLVEHVNFAKILPELLRVLKDDGEIRLGGLLLHFQLPDRLLPFHFGFDGYDGDFNTDAEATGGIDAWMKLLSEEKAIKLYGLTSGFSVRSEVRGAGIRTMSPVIIRKDLIIPAVQLVPEEEVKWKLSYTDKEIQDTWLNRFFEINPIPKPNYPKTPHLEGWEARRINSLYSSYYQLRQIN